MPPNYFGGWRSALPVTLKQPEPQADKEEGAGARSHPFRERRAWRSVAQGSNTICSVRFKCHCCRQLTQVPTQWTVRGRRLFIFLVVADQREGDLVS